MSAVREKNVAKIQSTYVKQQEYAEIATSRKRKLLIRRLSLFLAFAVFVSYFMVSSFITQASVIDAKKAQKKQLDKQLTALKKQQDVLKEEIV
ncbi:MAG: FtsB family cell division protein, partial [Neobacillus sp.]